MRASRPTARALTPKCANSPRPGAKRCSAKWRAARKLTRAQLRRLLDVLDAGDVLTVTRLDRLARSTRDLLNTLAAITAKKAGFKSLGDTGPTPRHRTGD
jgi:DNA invertase Pin-like site-specific DNA recombinase